MPVSNASCLILQSVVGGSWGIVERVGNTKWLLAWSWCRPVQRPPERRGGMLIPRDMLTPRNLIGVTMRLELKRDGGNSMRAAGSGVALAINTLG